MLAEQPTDAQPTLHLKTTRSSVSASGENYGLWRPTKAIKGTEQPTDGLGHGQRLPRQTLAQHYSLYRLPISAGNAKKEWISGIKCAGMIHRRIQTNGGRSEKCAGGKGLAKVENN